MYLNSCISIKRFELLGLMKARDMHNNKSDCFICTQDISICNDVCKRDRRTHLIEAKSLCIVSAGLTEDSAASRHEISFMSLAILSS